MIICFVSADATELNLCSIFICAYLNCNSLKAVVPDFSSFLVLGVVTIGKGKSMCLKFQHCRNYLLS